MKTISSCWGYLAWGITGLIGMFLFFYLAFWCNLGGWAIPITGVVMWFVLSILESIIASVFMFFANIAYHSGRVDKSVYGGLWQEACNHAPDISGNSFEAHIK